MEASDASQEEVSDDRNLCDGFFVSSPVPDSFALPLILWLISFHSFSISPYNERIFIRSRNKKADLVKHAVPA